MIGFGALAAFAAAVALWLTRKGTVPRSKWSCGSRVLGILAPFAANSAGWIFTEMGRQPFVVAPNPTPSGVDGVFMFTAAAVSPGVTAASSSSRSSRSRSSTACSWSSRCGCSCSSCAAASRAADAGAGRPTAGDRRRRPGPHDTATTSCTFAY